MGKKTTYGGGGLTWYVRYLECQLQNTQTDRQQDNPESLYQDNPDTLYKRCSRIAKVFLFYVSSWQGEEH